MRALLSLNHWYISVLGYGANSASCGHFLSRYLREWSLRSGSAGCSHYQKAAEGKFVYLPIIWPLIRKVSESHINSTISLSIPSKYIPRKSWADSHNGTFWKRWVLNTVKSTTLKSSVQFHTKETVKTILYNSFHVCFISIETGICELIFLGQIRYHCELLAKPFWLYQEPVASGSKLPSVEMDWLQLVLTFVKRLSHLETIKHQHFTETKSLSKTKKSV
jgi:hypothetical protein